MSRRPSRRDLWAEAWADAGRAMSLGWDLAVPIVGSALIGRFLEAHFQTGYETTVGLLALGVMVGFYNVAKKLREEILRDRYLAEHQEEEDEAL